MLMDTLMEIKTRGVLFYREGIHCKEGFGPQISHTGTDFTGDFGIIKPETLYI